MFVTRSLTPGTKILLWTSPLCVMLTMSGVLFCLNFPFFGKTYFDVLLRFECCDHHIHYICMLYMTECFIKYINFLLHRVFVWEADMKQALIYCVSIIELKSLCKTNCACIVMGVVMWNQYAFITPALQ